MDAIDYLLEGDPAIRWQTMRDLTDAPAEAVAAERARVATEGWGARMLALQQPDGRWDGGVYRPGWADETRPMYDAWTATHFSLQALRDYGLDPHSPLARRALDLVRSHVRWESHDRAYFDGETEPCINGVALAVGAYFSQDVDAIVETLLADRLGDGGWNCWAQYGARASSFHSTLCVLEGLREWEAGGREDSRVTEARLAGEEYLLERRLFHRRRDGAVVDPRFTMTSFPVRWYYDVLRALDYFRTTRGPDDPRMGEAVALVRGKADEHGLWMLENTHEGPIPFEMDDEREGFPSRWITLRARRVLRWADAVRM
jgi:hypothetical protein